MGFLEVGVGHVLEFRKFLELVCGDEIVGFLPCQVLKDTLSMRVYVKITVVSVGTGQNQPQRPNLIDDC